jgi:hypothetical protein
MTTALPRIYSIGREIALDKHRFGFLRSSRNILGNTMALRDQLEVDGYLYIPGFFDRELIFSARESLTKRLAERGLLDENRPSIEAPWDPAKRARFSPEILERNATVERVVFGPEIMGFYEALFGEPVRHFDFVWTRAIPPGEGTKPHCDIVFMGRGTSDLLTCWIPYGDVPLDLGGLMLLEGSGKKAALLDRYLRQDVDVYCENRPHEAKIAHEGGTVHDGVLSTNPVNLRGKLGGRWLTADWRAGDFATFKMNMVHCSLDNQTDHIRLSTDTRYQRLREPADERWVGPDPVGHSRAGKRGRIC